MYGERLAEVMQLVEEVAFRASTSASRSSWCTVAR
jgi:hypothetical protein